MELEELSRKLRLGSPDPRPIVPAVRGRVAVVVGRRSRAGERAAARCNLQASQVSGYCCESMFGAGSLQVSSGLFSVECLFVDGRAGRLMLFLQISVDTGLVLGAAREPPPTSTSKLVLTSVTRVPRLKSLPLEMTSKIEVNFVAVFVSLEV